ncbi:MAG: RNA polymerase sigma-54 factor, partial [Bacteroidales bacterium]|nr:RNA polymerase sigma-54 factor [Bacteroidales bacterium]
MLSQKQELRLTQKLSPRQILLMKLLQIPTISLEQRIKQELEDNPALESDDFEDNAINDSNDNMDEFTDDAMLSEADSTSDSEQTYDSMQDLDDYFAEDYDDIKGYRGSQGKDNSEDEVKEIPYISRQSFQESLHLQLGMFSLSAEDLQIAQYIIGSIDESGYLQRTAKEIVN